MKNARHLILFVCTGNICRSPMAEYLFRDFLRKAPGRRTHNREWYAGSCGLAATYGQPASHAAVEALNECGIDLAPHRSRPVSAELLKSAALIIGMTGAHCDLLINSQPEIEERTFLLNSFASPPAVHPDLQDPIGMSLDIYRRTRDDIRHAVPGLYDFINSLELQ